MLIKIIMSCFASLALSSYVHALDDFTVTEDYRKGRKLEMRESAALNRFVRRHNERMQDRIQKKREKKVLRAEKRRVDTNDFETDLGLTIRGEANIAAPIYDVYGALAHTQRRAAAAIEQTPGVSFSSALELFRRLHATVLYTGRTTDAEIAEIDPALETAIATFVMQERQPETLFLRIGGNLQLYGELRGAGKKFFGVPIQLSSSADQLLQEIIGHMPEGYNRRSHNMHVSLGCVTVASDREARLLATRIYEANIVANPFVISLNRLILMPSLGRPEVNYPIPSRERVEAVTTLEHIDTERERSLWEGYTLEELPSPTKKRKNTLWSDDESTFSDMLWTTLDTNSDSE